MYQQNKFDLPFCGLTKKIKPTGNKSPKFEYKADAKSFFTCSLTKKKYKLSQVNEWYLTPEVQKYHLQGYRAVWYGKTEHNENPNKYSKGDTNFVLSFIMIKPYKPQPNVDGMKPIAQAIPQPMQQVAKAEESFDDDLPPF